MLGLTDHTLTLQSFQNVRRQRLRVEHGRADSSVRFHFDHGEELPRFVHASLDGSAMKAYAACFEPYERQAGSPVLAMGYAMPEVCRGQGLAKAIFAADIAELRRGLAGHPSSFVEATIAPNDVASQRVSVAALGGEPKSITDQVSGQPALQYIRKFETELG